MRILDDLQSFQPSGLPKIWAIIGVVSVALAGAVAAPDDSGADAPKTTLLEWIEQLGDPSWSRREAATEHLLTLGPTVVDELRRAQRDHGDPEVRQRLDWLLAILDPPSHDIAVLRLGWPPEAEGFLPAAPAEVREWAVISLTGTAPGSKVTKNLDREGIHITLEVGGEQPHLAISVRRSDDSTTSGTKRVLGPGEVIPLRYEDHSEEDRVAGRIERRLRTSLWVVWHLGEEARAQLTDLLGDGATATDDDSVRDRIADALAATVRGQQRDVPGYARLAAFRIAAHWRRPELLTSHDAVPPEAVGNWLIARAAAHLRADDEAASRAEERRVAVTELENWFEEQLAGSGSALLDDAAIVLTESGAASGRRHLLRKLTDLTVWTQYLGIRGLVRRLDDPTTPAAEIAEIRDAVCSPTHFAFLPWNAVETEYLFQRVRERSPATEFGPLLYPLLEENLQTTSTPVPSRSGALLTALRGLIASRAAEPEEWFEPALEFLESNSFGVVFGIIRDAWLRGDIGAEEWARVIERLGDCLASDNISVSSRADRNLTTFLKTPQLSDADLVALWKGRLASYSSDGNNLKVSTDRLLNKLVGKLDGPAPRRNDTEAWEERAKQRAEQLDAAEPGALRAVPADHPRMVLTEADFRVDTVKRERKLVAFRRRIVDVGITFPESGPGGENWTISIEAPPTRVASSLAGKMNLGRGRWAPVGEPIVIQSYRPAYRRYTFVMSDASYGKRSQGTHQTVLFQTVVLLEEEDSALPGTSWDELATHIVAEATGDPASSPPWLAVVRDLRMTEALPALRGIFAERPSEDLARALLTLGDTSGMATLRELVNPNMSYQQFPVLLDLIAAGDVATIETALEWLQEPPPRLKARVGQLVDAIGRAVWGADSKVEIDDDRVLGAIIGALDQTHLRYQAIRLLNQRTGLEFGFIVRDPNLTPKQRTKAQNDAIAKWRQWWEKRSNSSG